MKNAVLTAVLAFPALALATATIKFSAPFTFPSTGVSPRVAVARHTATLLGMRVLPDGRLCLTWSGASKGSSMRLYNARGMTLIATGMPTSSGEILVPAVAGASGVYYAAVQDGNARAIVPVVMTR